MHVLKRLNLTLLLLSSSLITWAAPLPAPTETLVLNPAVVAETRVFFKTLNGISFQEVPSTVDSTQFLTQYALSFDPTALFFTKSDITELQKTIPFPISIADALREGDASYGLEAGTWIVNRILRNQQEIQALMTQPIPQFEHASYSRPDRPELQTDLNAAKLLWQEMFRSEILNNDLNPDPTSKIASTAEIYKIYARRFTTNTKRLRELTTSDYLSRYFNAYTYFVDPHTSFFTEKAASELQTAFNLEFQGIGAMLKLDKGYPTVTSVLSGGSAALSSQIHEGDKLMGVVDPTAGFIDFYYQSIEDCVSKIRGPANTFVTIRVATLANPNVPKDIPLKRMKVQLDVARAQSYVFTVDSHKLAVLRLDSFYGDLRDAAHFGAISDLRDLLTKLQTEHVEGIILDIRTNGGGLLDEAVGICGLFLPKGSEVVAAYNHTDTDPYITSTDPVYQGPLMVLTNRDSASASEIIAGALKDYHRAIIIGGPTTWGKGSVQNMMSLNELYKSPLEDKASIKVTTSTYHLPSGNSPQRTGIVSDVALPSLIPMKLAGEEIEPNAIFAGTIPAADYKPLTNLSPAITFLQQKAQEYVAQNPIYTTVTERNKLIESANTISLDPAVVQQQITTSEALKKKFDDYQIKYPFKVVLLDGVTIPSDVDPAKTIKKDFILETTLTTLKDWIEFPTPQLHATK